MKFDLSEATGAVQTMINGFIERLPYIAVALVVFLVFFFVSKGVRAEEPMGSSLAFMHFYVKS